METEGRQFTKKGEPMSKFVPRLSKDDAAAQGDMFLVLRNKTRLRIIDLLSRYGGLLCVVEIADVLGEQPSVISSHLALLRAVQFVTRETFGSYVYYSLEPGALIRYTQYLEQLISPMGEKAH
jgi:ArsR family transcriptional regulator, arsenate/arsenite/antimonite-responsive transcriptional repressor